MALHLTKYKSFKHCCKTLLNQPHAADCEATLEDKKLTPNGGPPQKMGWKCWNCGQVFAVEDKNHVCGPAGIKGNLKQSLDSCLFCGALSGDEHQDGCPSKPPILGNLAALNHAAYVTWQDTTPKLIFCEACGHVGDTPHPCSCPHYGTSDYAAETLHLPDYKKWHTDGVYKWQGQGKLQSKCISCGSPEGYYHYAGCEVASKDAAAVCTACNHAFYNNELHTCVDGAIKPLVPLHKCEGCGELINNYSPSNPSNPPCTCKNGSGEGALPKSNNYPAITLEKAVEIPLNQEMLMVLQDIAESLHKIVQALSKPEYITQIEDYHPNAYPQKKKPPS